METVTQNEKEKKLEAKKTGMTNYGHPLFCLFPSLRVLLMKIRIKQFFCCQVHVPFA